jgi:DNA-binding transcriptional regulator LsrR (DeoR family)
MANRITRNDTTRLARRAFIYRGLQAQVASSLGLSRAHVSLVCRGLRTSRRVEKALAEAVLRIQKEAA